MSEKPKGRIRTYGIPRDLELMRHLGFTRHKWTRAAMERSLDEIENYPVPDGFGAHMAAIHDSVGDVRRTLASDGVEAATPRMNDIESLIDDIVKQLERPDIRRGRKSLADVRKAAAASRKMQKRRSQSVMTEMERIKGDGYNVTDAARFAFRRGHGVSAAANRGLWYRQRRKPKK